MTEPRTIAHPATLATKPLSGYVSSTKLAEKLKLDSMFLRAPARAGRVKTARDAKGELLIDKKSFMKLIAD